MARLMSAGAVTETAAGVYRVEHEGRSQIVYVAGPPGDRWAFWNGRVFRDTPPDRRRVRSAEGTSDIQSLAAPMPATVVRVLVQVGTAVRKGDPLVLLEAMKMELPVRADADAVVVAI